MTESAPSSQVEARKRRSTRIVQAVPLTVIGVDALGRPFQERTSTLIINCHGCRYQSKHYVLKNMWVTFEVPSPETGREPRTGRARVTWVQRPRSVRELFQIGTELEVSGNFWGIAFPPEDWFPYPETPSPGIPPLVEQAVAPAQEWVLPGTTQREDNVRVLPAPTPSPAEASLSLARQMARLVVEAKQQLEAAIHEATAKAVEVETRPLLSALQTQLKLAAERSVQAAVASQIEEVRRAGTNAMQEQLSRQVERYLGEAGEQLSARLTQIEETREKDFAHKLDSKLGHALQNLKKVASEMEARIPSVGVSVPDLQKQFEDSTEAASRRFQDILEGRTGEVKTRLEQLERVAQKLQDQVTVATTVAQARWRAQLEADVAAAGTRWNERTEASLESAARQAGERLERGAQAVVNNLEQEFSSRLTAFRQSFEQATSEAENTLARLRATINQENNRARASLEEIQQVASRLEEHSSKLEELSRTTAEELQQRFEAILATESAELNRRAESAVAGMADRLQPVLEAAGQQTVARLASQLEQELAPHLHRAGQVLQKLTAGKKQIEETLQEQDERLRRASEESIQECSARLREAAGRLERDFQEAGRATTASWLSDLDAKATDTMHNTFEALYKSSEWYEKKVQTQMQTALEKGLEQAANSLREKAGELSSAFATELDHYSRSYVEHSRDQMEETVQDAVEGARRKLTQAAETTAAALSDEAQRIAQGTSDKVRESAGASVEQAATQIQAHGAQARSQMDHHARQFVAEFRTSMSREIQQGVVQARQELEAQVAPVQEAWRTEREAQERNFKESVARLSDESIDGYKKRLENVSNSWLVATVTSLNQQSLSLIGTLTNAAEQRLRETCSQVFASVGETLRQRLLDLSTDLASTTPPSKEK